MFRSRKSYGIIAVLTFFTIASHAQHIYRLGWLPQINTSFSLQNNWKLNTELENRVLLLEGPKSNFSNSRSRLERSDIELVLTKKTGARGTAGAGYLIRLEDGLLIHRFIQQYSFVQKLNGIRLAHRFRTDETFEKREAPQYRARYRIGIEKPLNGQSIDPRELYIKITNEYLGIFQSGNFNLDIRGLAVAGYMISDKFQWEIGIDYRAEELLSADKENQFWLSMTWYSNL